MTSVSTKLKLIVISELIKKGAKQNENYSSCNRSTRKRFCFTKRVKAITNGGSNYAVETTGVPPVVKQSLNALRPLGTCAIVGVTPEMPIDVHNDIMAEGKTMMGVIEGDSVPRVFIPQLVSYYKDGKFPFDRLVKFYEFEQINEAFEDSKTGISIKPILKIAK